MRWDSLFDDLESQLEHELNADDADLMAEEHRLRLARLAMRDRMLAATSDDAGPIAVELRNGETIRVQPRSFGRDWIAADLVSPAGTQSPCIVVLDAVTGVVLPRSRISRSIEQAVGEQPRLTDRIGLAFALRDLCRRRSYVGLHTAGGAHHGTIDRVGRDHLDLAVHEPGTPRRERAVVQYRIIPFCAITLVTMS